MNKQNNNSIYKKKIIACEHLVNKNAKRITKSHFYTVANEVSLKPSQVERAWNNFVQSGGTYVDGRVRNRDSSGKHSMPKGINFKKNPSQKGLLQKDNVSSTLARKIIFEYMTSNKSLVSVANSYGVAFQAAYEWIHELSVHGTICGQLILDVKKYAKMPIIDVIHLYKKPNTTRQSIRNLSDIEKLAYKRVATVLLKYLYPESVI